MFWRCKTIVVFSSNILRVIESEKLALNFFELLPSHVVFSFLVGSQNKRVIRAVAEFVWKAFQIRSEVLCNRQKD